MMLSTDENGARRAIRRVACLTLGYFIVEFAVAATIGSVSLFADSMDFLEDTCLNILVALALGWSASNRARLGVVLAGLLFVPGLATAWTAFQKVTTALVPEALSLSLAGVGAMGVNIACVLLLIRYQRHYGSLVRAAFLSARAHVLTNIAIIGAGLVTGFLWHSIWPDVIVGLIIALINFDAAWEVAAAARKEYRQAHS